MRFKIVKGNKPQRKSARTMHPKNIVTTNTRGGIRM